MNLTEVALGLAWFALFVASAYMSVRSLPRRSPAILVVVMAAGITLLSAAVSAAITANANYWRILAIETFLMMVYLMAFGATYKSISLRILNDLWESSARELPADVIFTRYIESESFDARIGVMLNYGWARQSADGITLTARGRRLARLVRFVQRLYSIDKSG